MSIPPLNQQLPTVAAAVSIQSATPASPDLVGVARDFIEHIATLINGATHGIKVQSEGQTRPEILKLEISRTELLTELQNWYSPNYERAKNPEIEECLCALYQLYTEKKFGAQQSFGNDTGVFASNSHTLESLQAQLTVAIAQSKPQSTATLVATRRQALSDSASPQDRALRLAVDSAQACGATLSGITGLSCWFESVLYLCAFDPVIARHLHIAVQTPLDTALSPEQAQRQQRRLASLTMLNTLAGHVRAGSTQDLTTTLQTMRALYFPDTQGQQDAHNFLLHLMRDLPPTSTSYAIQKRHTIEIEGEDGNGSTRGTAIDTETPVSLTLPWFVTGENPFRARHQPDTFYTDESSRIRSRLFHTDHIIPLQDRLGAPFQIHARDFGFQNLQPNGDGVPCIPVPISLPANNSAAASSSTTEDRTELYPVTQLIAHRGSLEYGHYWAAFRAQDGNWYLKHTNGAPAQKLRQGFASIPALLRESGFDKYTLIGTRPDIVETPLPEPQILGGSGAALLSAAAAASTKRDEAADLQAKKPPLSDEALVAIREKIAAKVEISTDEVTALAKAFEAKFNASEDHDDLAELLHQIKTKDLCTSWTARANNIYEETALPILKLSNAATTAAAVSETVAKDGTNDGAPIRESDPDYDSEATDLDDHEEEEELDEEDQAGALHQRPN